MSKEMRHVHLCWEVIKDAPAGECDNAIDAWFTLVEIARRKVPYQPSGGEKWDNRRKETA